jgi:preprotein translocase subunit SecG
MAFMGFGQIMLLVVLFLTAVFLIVLVLIQRGKGGGLAGALGGMGGQSAFGTKAGDLFTRITIGVAFFWIVLCLASGRLLAPRSSKLEGIEVPSANANEQPGTPSDKAAEKGPAPASTPASTPTK